MVSTKQVGLYLEVKLLAIRGGQSEVVLKLEDSCIE